MHRKRAWDTQFKFLTSTNCCLSFVKALSGLPENYAVFKFCRQKMRFCIMLSLITFNLHNPIWQFVTVQYQMFLSLNQVLRLDSFLQKMHAEFLNQSQQ